MSDEFPRFTHAPISGSLIARNMILAVALYIRATLDVGFVLITTSDTFSLICRG